MRIHKQHLTKVVKSAVLIAVACVVVNPGLGWASDNTVVSIFVDGNKKVVSTNASTVGEVLERAQVDVQPQDLVEPASSTEFTSAIFNINVYRAKPVVVVDGGKQISVNSPYQNPKLIAERSAGLIVYPEDEYQTELIRDVLNGIGMKVHIKRATPVTVKIDNLTLPLRTQQATVQKMFTEKGIVLGEADQLNTAQDAAITAGMEIVVTRVGHELVAVEEVIPAPVQYVYDDNKPTSYEAVQEPGADGKRYVTYEIIRHDGQEVGRQERQAVVVTAAKTKVIVRGVQQVGGADWAGLRACESGGNYQNRSNSTYRGAYQFSYSTWESVGGSGDPADAPPAEQDYRAQLLYQRAGKYQWPVCGPRYLP